jgi:acetylornithine/N-succinyldiaminopimelate aminotransferase
MEEKEHEGGREAELLRAADAYLMRTYQPARMVITHGEGSWLYDSEGRKYLDFCAGVAVCCLGHAHPAIVETITRQAGRVMHVSNYFFNEENVCLAEELCKATGFDRGFFCNSGAEANEAMLKLVRRWFHHQGRPRARVIAFEQAFHGRTFGALALTGNPKYLEGYGEPLAGIEHVPYGDLGALEARMGDDVAAVFVEPVQGEGGVNVAPEGFLAGVRALCDAHGSLMAVDEIQTGVGRTGRLLASEGVRADAISLAKGLGGGVPIGVMLTRDDLAVALPPGSHGSTFGGNPLASAVARTVLRHVTEEGFFATVRERGESLSRGLTEVAKRHPALCGRERGVGLLRALALTDGVEPRTLLPILRDHGLLAAAGGARALRFIPPLIVTPAEIDEAMARLDRALAAAERSIG